MKHHIEEQRVQPSSAPSETPQKGSSPSSSRGLKVNINPNSALIQPIVMTDDYPNLARNERVFSNPRLNPVQSRKLQELREQARQLEELHRQRSSDLQRQRAALAEVANDLLSSRSVSPPTMSNKKGSKIEVVDYTAEMRNGFIGADSKANPDEKAKASSPSAVHNEPRKNSSKAEQMLSEWLRTRGHKNEYGMRYSRTKSAALRVPERINSPNFPIPKDAYQHTGQAHMGNEEDSFIRKEPATDSRPECNHSHSSDDARFWSCSLPTRNAHPHLADAGQHNFAHRTRSRSSSDALAPPLDPSGTSSSFSGCKTACGHFKRGLTTIKSWIAAPSVRAARRKAPTSTELRGDSDGSNDLRTTCKPDGKPRAGDDFDPVTFSVLDRFRSLNLHWRPRSLGKGEGLHQARPPNEPRLSNSQNEGADRTETDIRPAARCQSTDNEPSDRLFRNLQRPATPVNEDEISSIVALYNYYGSSSPENLTTNDSPTINSVFNIPTPILVEHDKDRSLSQAVQTLMSRQGQVEQKMQPLDQAAPIPSTNVLDDSVFDRRAATYRHIEQLVQLSKISASSNKFYWILPDSGIIVNGLELSTPSSKESASRFISAVNASPQADILNDSMPAEPNPEMELGRKGPGYLRYSTGVRNRHRRSKVHQYTGIAGCMSSTFDILTHAKIYNAASNKYLCSVNRLRHQDVDLYSTTYTCCLTPPPDEETSGDLSSSSVAHMHEGLAEQSFEKQSSLKRASEQLDATVSNSRLLAVKDYTRVNSDSEIDVTDQDNDRPHPRHHQQATNIHRRSPSTPEIYESHPRLSTSSLEPTISALYGCTGSGAASSSESSSPSPPEIPLPVWTTESNLNYVVIANTTAIVTCGYCLRKFFVTLADPNILERHQRHYCSTLSLQQLQRWYCYLETLLGIGTAEQQTRAVNAKEKKEKKYRRRMHALNDEMDRMMGQMIELQEEHKAYLSTIVASEAPNDGDQGDLECVFFNMPVIGVTGGRCAASEATLETTARIGRFLSTAVDIASRIGRAFSCIRDTSIGASRDERADMLLGENDEDEDEFF
ncbi:hypothetical protein BGZ54_009064 [Gamsiella multidivaricata]|nr:hypothetical protein BGZ54_009064 [Gamsiella multidivaricata]